MRATTTYVWPALFTLAATAGLLLALLRNGVLEWVALAMIAAPIVAFAVFWQRARKRRPVAGRTA